MEEIVNVAQWCFHFDTGKTGMTTYGELKLGLQTNGYSATDIDSIYVDSSVDNEGPLEFRDFLASCLEARGSFEETILTETFERSFPDEDSYITKYEVAGLLTAVGTPERVEEFFPDWDELKGEDSRSKYSVICIMV
jgi:Ca2+-binding EF-hand superfamily protein